MPLTVPARADHIRITSTDAEQLLEFERVYFRVDALILTNAVLIGFSPDGQDFGTLREYPAGVTFSQDRIVRALKFRSAVAGLHAKLDVDLFFDPVEVVGRELK